MATATPSGREHARRAAALLAAAASLAAALGPGCATAPRPTARSLHIAAQPRATVEGRVRDPEGRPVAGIGVRGLPRGAEIPWSPPATTACDGTFRLPLAAPGDYGFLLVWKGESVVTADPRDPALLQVSVKPGESRDGVELVFLADEWRAITAVAPAETPSCH